MLADVRVVSQLAALLCARQPDASINMLSTQRSFTVGILPRTPHVTPHSIAKVCTATVASFFEGDLNISVSLFYLYIIY